MRKRCAPLILLAATLGACAPVVSVSAPSAPAVAAGEVWIEDRLYFGRDIPGGGRVSDEEWSTFLREVVTPRFPDGLTIVRAEGQWRDGQGRIITEPSTVVELMHPASAQADAAVEAIAAEYKRRFRQEAVMRVRVPADVRFFEE
jgi:hypothetical protein